jgi:hypothetical protein
MLSSWLSHSLKMAKKLKDYFNPVLIVNKE